MYLASDRGISETGVMAASGLPGEEEQAGRSKAVRSKAVPAIQTDNQKR